MIVREIKDDPGRVLQTFDWFNDYRDTRDYARAVCPELVGLLDAGYEKYLSEVHRKARETVDNS